MRIRWLSTAAVAILTFGAVSESQAQFRGGPPNPDESFNRMLASYGGTGDVVDLAKVPQDYRDRMNRFAQFTGAAPLPTSGSLSREQYRVDFTKRMESMQSRGGFGGGGSPGGFGGSPGGFGGATATVTISPSPAGGSSPAPGGGPPAMTTEQIQAMMQRYDRNGDGRVSMEEASDRLKPVFQQYDSNRDGTIDVTEYSTYMQDRMSGRGPSGASSSGPGSSFSSNQSNSPPSYQPSYSYGSGGSPQQYERKQEDQLIERPTVYRFGKLPKGVPSWFEQLDSDTDGQIGLYEWRSAKRETVEFVDMDLNGDGYLTAEEWLRFTRLALEKKPSTDDELGTTQSSTAASIRSGSSTAERGGPPSRGMTGSFTFGGKSSEKGKDDKAKEEKRNPFTGGRR